MSLNTTPRTWVAGEVVTAAYMNTEVRDAITGLQAAWTAYSPVWTAVTVNPTLGNGTLVGAWCRVGKTVIGFRTVLTLGSTSTTGTGGFQLTIPSAAMNVGRVTSWADLTDTGTANYVGRLVASSGSVTAQLLCPGTVAGGAERAVSSTVPFTWGNTDQLTVTGSTFELP